MKPVTTKGGRPRGSRPINRRALVTAYNRSLEPYTEELLQRAVAQALAGDREVMGGLLALIGHAMMLADGHPAAMRAG